MSVVERLAELPSRQDLEALRGTLRAAHDATQELYVTIENADDAVYSFLRDYGAVLSDSPRRERNSAIVETLSAWGVDPNLIREYVEESEGDD